MMDMSFSLLSFLAVQSHTKMLHELYAPPQSAKACPFNRNRLLCSQIEEIKLAKNFVKILHHVLIRE